MPVSSGEIMKLFELPRTTLYRLVRAGTIPAHELPGKSWYKRKHYQFYVSEVARALNLPPSA